MAQEFCFRDARVEELADEEVPRHTVPKRRTTTRVVFHFRLDDDALFPLSRRGSRRQTTSSASESKNPIHTEDDALFDEHKSVHVVEFSRVVVLFRTCLLCENSLSLSLSLPSVFFSIKTLSQDSFETTFVFALLSRERERERERGRETKSARAVRLSIAEFSTQSTRVHESIHKSENIIIIIIIIIIITIGQESNLNGEKKASSTS